MNTKLIMGVAAVLIAGGGLYWWMGQTGAAPAIAPRQFSDADEDPAFSLPSNPVVTTTSGEEIELMLLMQVPPAGKGIYRYGRELYSYDMSTYAFTRLPNGDASTFEIDPGSFSFPLYAKDKNNVYCMGEVLAGADAATFRAIPDFDPSDPKFEVQDTGAYTNFLYYQDKANQYVFGECEPYSKSS